MLPVLALPLFILLNLFSTLSHAALCSPCDYSFADQIIGIRFPISVAFSPDGSCLAIADTNNNQVTVYSMTGCTASAMPVSTITGLNSPLSVAFSSDNSCLAIADSGNNQVKVYSMTGCTASAMPVSTITGLNFPRSVAFSPDNSCLAIADTNNNQVKVYSMTGCSASAMPVSTITGLSLPRSVAFSPDNSCLAIADTSNNQVKVYSMTGCTASAMPVSTITGLSFPVSVAFSSDGSCLAMAGGNVDIYRNNQALSPVLIQASAQCGALTIIGSGAEANATIEVFADGVLIGNGAAAVDGTFNFIIDTSLASGIHSITVTQTNSLSCTSEQSNAIDVAIATPTITLTASPTPICPGSTSTLSATVTGGTEPSTVVFTGPNVLSDPIAGPNAEFVVTPAATAMYTATVTDAAGCTAAATTQVSVNPLPTISISANPLVIAPGQSSTLTTFLGSGTPPYSVEFSDGFISPISSDTIVTHQVSPASTTTYSATVTDFLGCISDPPATITLTVSATPPTPPDNLKVILCGPKCRISKSGCVKISGKATPGAIINIYANSRCIGKAKASVTGKFCIVPCRRLNKGCNTIVALAKIGQSKALSNKIKVLVKSCR